MGACVACEWGLVLTLEACFGVVGTPASPGLFLAVVAVGVSDWSPLLAMSVSCSRSFEAQGLPFVPLVTVCQTDAGTGQIRSCKQTLEVGL